MYLFQYVKYFVATSRLARDFGVILRRANRLVATKYLRYAYKVDALRSRKIDAQSFIHRRSIE